MARGRRFDDPQIRNPMRVIEIIEIIELGYREITVSE